MSDRERKSILSDVFQTRYREVTVAAIVFAIVIGVVMNAAITYAGLKIGFTLGGSAIAAVLGFGVLRGVLRKGTILETNIAQTIASAVNTSNSGVIFTVPVLLLIGFELSIGGRDFWLITLACVGGAMLGTAFIIPLRKQMLDIERLRFPSPTGVASILKSPGAGPAKSVVLLLGMVIGALIFLPAGLPALGPAADLDDLDHLVETDRISAGDAALTREIAGWIDAGSAPETVITAGQLRIAADEAREDYNVALEQNPSEAGAAEATLDEAEAAYTAHVAAAELGRFPADLQRMAFRVERGGEGDPSIDALRDKKLGWAMDPYTGYADAQWRMPEVADERFPEQLSARVDRNGDGKPDLIMTDSTIDVGRFLGLPEQMQVIFAIAPFALGAGYITGRAGLFVLAGGILAFIVLNPLAYTMGWMPASVRADAAPGFGFAAFNRPLGIGLLLGGALMGVAMSLPAIKEAVKSIAAAGRIKGTSDELGLKTLAVAVLGGLVFLFLAADIIGNRPLNETCPITEGAVVESVETATHGGYTIAFSSDEALATFTTEWDEEQRDGYLDAIGAKPGLLAGLNPHLRAAIIAVIGALWIWFAGIIIAQCAGMTDWSPISGLALLTVVLVLLLGGTAAVVSAVLVGAALCVAITLAADMMGDMKTGYLVGAKPLRQQVVELLVVGIGPIVCMLTVVLIAESNMKQFGIAMGPGTDTVAPQAQALQAVVIGVQGGEMPYALYGVGALLGVLLGLGAFSGLGVLIGLSMYLPFQYIATYGIGCVINMIVAKIFGKERAEGWGVPFCAGLIVGESILQLGINIVVLAG